MVITSLGIADGRLGMSKPVIVDELRSGSVAGNSEIVLRIAGQSSTKQRPRFNAFLGRAYTPAANIINENDVRAVWREAGEPRIEDDTAIEIAIIISVERPKSHFKADG